MLWSGWAIRALSLLLLLYFFWGKRRHGVHVGLEVSQARKPFSHWWGKLMVLGQAAPGPGQGGHWQIKTELSP